MNTICLQTEKLNRADRNLLKHYSETDPPLKWIRECLRGQYTVILDARSRQGELLRPVVISYDQTNKSRFHGR